MKMLFLIWFFLSMLSIENQAQRVIEGGELKVGEEFFSGDVLYSANKEYLLSLTPTGDLWLVNGNWDFLWKSNSSTEKCTKAVLRLQTDGNLCIYDVSDEQMEKFIWCNLVDKNVSRVMLTDQGFFQCVQENGQLIWSRPKI